MESFYATLAQISATLLAILAAAVAAYFVFLQDRSAQFEDKIQQNKIAIAESLFDLRAAWPPALSMYFPAEFHDSYRSRYPNQGRAQLISQAAIDLIFGHRAMTETLDEVDDSLGGPWEGRAYFWILSQAVNVLTVGMVDTPSSPQGVFPSSATGPGFAEWRRDFNELRPVASLFSDFKEPMLSSFEQFAKNLPSATRSSGSSHYASRAAERFINQFDNLNAKLADIDRQKVLKESYSFPRRINSVWLMILCGMALVLGVVFPLAVLALELEPSRVAGIAILTAAMALLLGAFIQFGWDIASPVKIDPREYLSGRWLNPLLNQLRTHEAKVQHAGLLDLDMVIDASNSADRKAFSLELSESLVAYLAAAKNYNKEALKLNNKVVDRIHSDATLGPLLTKSSGRGGPSLYPSDVFNERRLDEVSKQLVRTPNSNISIEVDMPRWTKVTARIPGNAFAGEPSRLIEALKTIGKELVESPEERDFLRVKEQLTRDADRLRAALESEL